VLIHQRRVNYPPRRTSPDCWRIYDPH
jgi:hypothetical protein